MGEISSSSVGFGLVLDATGDFSTLLMDWSLVVTEGEGFLLFPFSRFLDEDVAGDFCFSLPLGGFSNPFEVDGTGDFSL